MHLLLPVVLLLGFARGEKGASCAWGVGGVGGIALLSQPADKSKESRGHCNAAQAVGKRALGGCSGLVVVRGPGNSGWARSHTTQQAGMQD